MPDDTPEVIPGRVAIVSPSGEVLNKGAKRAKYDGAGKRATPPADFMKGLVSREEVVEHMTTAALEVGDKMYQQMSGEVAEYLEQMEQAIYERVMREIDARSFRGRLRRLWWRIRPPAPELVVATTTAIEALDPINKQGPLQRRKGDGPEGSHLCPTCGAWCVCAEWYDGDRCEHHNNFACKSNDDISPNDK